MHLLSSKSLPFTQVVKWQRNSRNVSRHNTFCLYAYNKQKKTPSSLFRNFFTKRTKELKPAVQSAPGWKLFGKVPPRENLPKDSKIIQQVSKHHTTLGRKIVKITHSYYISLLLYPQLCYMTTECSENTLLGLCLSNSSY